MSIRKVVLGLLALLALGACGVKSPIQTPPVDTSQSTTPARPVSLSLTTTGERERVMEFVSSTTAGRNQWTHVGVNAFTGTHAEGLKLLGYPKEVQEGFLRLMENRQGKPVLMPDGTVYTAQVYGKNAVWKNVQQKIGRDLRGMLYVFSHGGKTYTLFYPPKADGGCDNLSDLTPTGAVATNASSPKAPPQGAPGGAPAASDNPFAGFNPPRG